MRHRVAHRKLGRVSEHRMALLRNQATALIRHERISTTVAKAKELRPFVERLITVAKRGIAEGTDTTRALHARRLVARDMVDREILSKLFDTIAPRFATRPGGYTRLLRSGRRQGDDAPLAQVELLGSEYSPKAEGDEAESGAQTAASGGVGSRLRRAARRIRGGGKTESPQEIDGDASPSQTKRTAGKRSRKKTDS